MLKVKLSISWRSDETEELDVASISCGWLGNSVSIGVVALLETMDGVDEGSESSVNAECEEENDSIKTSSLGSACRGTLSLKSGLSSLSRC
jgi:hypothetical protein